MKGKGRKVLISKKIPVKLILDHSQVIIDADFAHVDNVSGLMTCTHLNPLRKHQGKARVNIIRGRDNWYVVQLETDCLRIFSK